MTTEDIDQAYDTLYLSHRINITAICDKYSSLASQQNYKNNRLTDIVTSYQKESHDMSKSILRSCNGNTYTRKQKQSLNSSKVCEYLDSIDKDIEDRIQNFLFDPNEESIPVASLHQHRIPDRSLKQLDKENMPHMKKKHGTGKSTKRKSKYDNVKSKRTRTSVKSSESSDILRRSFTRAGKAYDRKSLTCANIDNSDGTTNRNHFKRPCGPYQTYLNSEDLEDDLIRVLPPCENLPVNGLLSVLPSYQYDTSNSAKEPLKRESYGYLTLTSDLTIRFITDMASIGSLRNLIYAKKVPLFDEPSNNATGGVNEEPIRINIKDNSFPTYENNEVDGGNNITFTKKSFRKMSKKFDTCKITDVDEMKQYQKKLYEKNEGIQMETDPNNDFKRTENTKEKETIRNSSNKMSTMKVVAEISELESIKETSKIQFKNMEITKDTEEIRKCAKKKIDRNESSQIIEKEPFNKCLNILSSNVEKTRTDIIRDSPKNDRKRNNKDGEVEPKLLYSRILVENSEIMETERNEVSPKKIVTKKEIKLSDVEPTKTYFKSIYEHTKSAEINKIEKSSRINVNGRGVTEVNEGELIKKSYKCPPDKNNVPLRDAEFSKMSPNINSESIPHFSSPVKIPLLRKSINKLLIKNVHHIRGKFEKDNNNTGHFSEDKISFSQSKLETNNIANCGSRNSRSNVPSTAVYNFNTTKAGSAISSFHMNTNDISHQSKEDQISYRCSKSIVGGVSESFLNHETLGRSNDTKKYGDNGKLVKSTEKLPKSFPLNTPKTCQFTYTSDKNMTTIADLYDNNVSVSCQFCNKVYNNHEICKYSKTVLSELSLGKNVSKKNIYNEKPYLHSPIKWHKEESFTLGHIKKIKSLKQSFSQTACTFSCTKEFSQSEENTSLINEMSTFMMMEKSNNVVGKSLEQSSRLLKFPREKHTKRMLCSKFKDVLNRTALSGSMISRRNKELAKNITLLFNA